MSWWVTVTAMSALTLWVLFKGYRVVTGQSREIAMDLVVTALRAVLIIGVAMSMVSAARPGASQSDGLMSGLYWKLTDGLSSAIVKTVTGDTRSPYEAIDRNLFLMQVALTSIDQIQTGGDADLSQKKDQARLFTGLGMAGPGVVGGSLLLLNKLAMALFVGFGPLFILCLLFDATKSLFQKWLMYGIGTVFSLSVLSFTVSLATKVVGVVGTGFLAKWSVTGGTGEGVSGMALQQGGIGLVLTTLIVTSPPMAAAFFQGTLGQFTAYSAFGQMGKDPATGQPYTPQAPMADASGSTGTAKHVGQVETRTSGVDASNSNVAGPGSRGLASNNKDV
ncbi:type IV secretion system protein [Xanthomonas theicola]|nr:type IV secretion system protein [Xanthomonas theicola]